LIRPSSQILYIYGGFVRRLGGWLPVATLLDLMFELGAEAAVVRAALTRMKRSGLLASVRRGGIAGYALTEASWRILEEGDRRMLTAREPADAEDGWVLVIFSVPETQRHKRHQLRNHLAWLGFGTIAPGAWIAPRRLRRELETVLQRARLLDFTERLDVAYEGVAASRRLAHKCWDLAALDRMYCQFAERWECANAAAPAAAFETYIALVADWRRLPFLDPGLPSEILPDRWAGARARSIYFSLLGRIDALALEYVSHRVAERNLVVATREF
jgi:phenylacetic acid degradation operon negative regulatory protein